MVTTAVIRSVGRLASVPVLGLGLLGLTISVASAAPINYGAYNGTTVIFTNVTETANSAGDLPPLFGAPTPSGDSLNFNPIGFNAAAAGAAGSDITDGQLSLGIHAKPGFGIPQVIIKEAGDTTIVGFGSNATMTGVFAYVNLQIYEVDGVGINAIPVSTTISMTPHGGQYKLGDQGGGPFYTTAWSGLLTLDVNQILTDNGISFTLGATKLSINMNNTLIATSQAGTQSFIAKKTTNGVIITVPEPSSAMLALLGLGGLGCVRRRR